MSGLGWAVVGFAFGLAVGIVAGLYLWVWIEPEYDGWGQE